MTISGDVDLQGLRAIGRVVARCLRAMSGLLAPGAITADIDHRGAEFLAARGARSAPRLSYNFPGSTCISVNEEVAHGIPGARVLAAGDVVHLDVSAELEGYYADVGATFVIGAPNSEQRNLCNAGRQALRRTLDVVRAGAPVRALGAAIEDVARRYGLGVIRNLGSHGIGRSLHEEPKFVPGFDDPNEQRTLEEGQVIALEPFVTTGLPSVTTAADGWTLLNRPGSITAQFEHTLVVTSRRPLLLTLP